MSDELEFTINDGKCAGVYWRGRKLDLIAQERRILHHLWYHDTITWEDIAKTKRQAAPMISKVRRKLKDLKVPYVLRSQGRGLGAWVFQPVVDSSEQCCPFCGGGLPPRFYFFDGHVYWGSTRIDLSETQVELMHRMASGREASTSVPNHISKLRHELRRLNVPYVIEHQRHRGRYAMKRNPPDAYRQAEELLEAYNPHGSARVPVHDS